jgi:hypothetical protein
LFSVSFPLGERRARAVLVEESRSRDNGIEMWY